MPTRKKTDKRNEHLERCTRCVRQPLRKATPLRLFRSIVKTRRPGGPIQEKLAASAGLSLLLVDGRQPPAIVASNNNSICHAFQSSMEHVSLCDPYCGDAHRRALRAGSAVPYKCHAGLQCFTVPVQIGGEQNLAAIGAAHLSAWTTSVPCAIAFARGELNDLLASEPLKNVIFAEPERVNVVRTIAKRCSAI